jgi:flagellar biosynthesis anti-sigma factor FlgM
MQIHENISLRMPSMESSKLEGLEPGGRGGKVVRLGDRVEVSDRVRMLRAAQEELESAPDVRMDLVQSLRWRIESGTYEVPGREVARKMLAELRSEAPAVIRLNAAAPAVWRAN